MAEGGTGQPTTIQCGYCLVKDDEMNDPRVLPCSHVFCTSCMIGQYEDVGAVTCPTCSTTFEGDVNSLPQSVTQNSTQLCDACMKKDGTEKLAVSFCTTCSKRLCRDHLQYHDELNCGHTTMSITEFQTDANKLSIRYCSEHASNKFTLGCQVCKQVLCLSCANSTNRCIDDKHHELIHLDELESTLKKTFGERCKDVAAKEANIAKLYKEFSKMASDYQVETTEMVSLLQSTRDEQIQTITAKYKVLEEELLQSRTEVQKQMETFMEEEVNNVLSALSSQRKRIEDKYRSSHQVDVVLEHDSTLAKLKELADRKVEECKIQNIKPESNAESAKEFEVRLAAIKDMYVSFGENKQEKRFRLPESVEFSKSVSVSSFCHSICYAGGNIFVGTQNKTIEVVDRDFNTKEIEIKVIASLQAWPYGMVPFGSEIYALSTDVSNSNNIASYDYFGQLLSTWKRMDECHYTRPAVVSNQFIVPDPSNKRITVYSLSGELIKHITGLSWLDEANCLGTALTAIDSNSVVVTCHSSSLIFKVNIKTGETIWKCDSVSSPQGVAVYNKDHVCVVSDEKLSFIDTCQGVVQKVIVDSKIGSQALHNMDIEIFGTTVVVSAKEEGLNFFDINL